MKHVLLPTDFSIRSLQPIHDVMRHYSPDAVRITLLHLVCMPSGINDLLFRTSKIYDRHPIPAAFTEACEVIGNRYSSRICGIRTIIRHGETRAFVENLVNSLKVDATFIQSGYIEVAAFKDSLPLIPLLTRTGLNIIETSPAIQKEAVGVATVGDLLLTAG